MPVVGRDKTFEAGMEAEIIITATSAGKRHHGIQEVSDEEDLDHNQQDLLDTPKGDDYNVYYLAKYTASYDAQSLDLELGQSVTYRRTLCDCSRYILPTRNNQPLAVKYYSKLKLQMVKCILDLVY